MATKYVYRIQPKGNLATILRDGGLSTILPGSSPGSYVDAPEEERWPDQDFDEPQTARLYFAIDQWSDVGKDRFCIRVPLSVVDDELEGPDSLGDYYIDTGEREFVVIDLDQFDALINKKWVPGTRLKGLKLGWDKFYLPPGHFGNLRYE